METQGQHFVFRLNDHGEGPEVIREVLMEQGWLEFDEDSQEDGEWNLWWRTSRFRKCDYTQLNPWQRLNHFPGATAITRKDCLARHMRCMQGVYGSSVFDFSPLAFNLPNDYTKFVAETARLKERGKDSLYWICKPADLSRGRGIFIFKEPLQLTYDSNAVVQQYIRNPMLISGYKFDLRLYIAVTCFKPLRFYVYEEGLVRFSTEKFDLTSLDNLFSHLTNTSINKHSPSYNSEKERVGSGCKWTITQLRHYFRQNSINDQPIWAKICNIIILTLLIQAGSVQQSPGSFELYGFDILLDDNLKPWLLEVNFSPAMSVDCATDSVVKKPMLCDLLSMLNLQEIDKLRGAEQERGQIWQTRNSWQPVSTRQSRSYSVQGRFPSIQGTVSDSRLTGSWGEEEEEGARVMAGRGLPSVQQRSLSVAGWSSCEKNKTGSLSSKSYSKTSLHSLHSDSGVSSMSGLSERTDEEPSVTRKVPNLNLVHKPFTNKPTKDRVMQRVTSSKVTPRRLPASTHRTDYNRGKVHGRKDWSGVPSSGYSRTHPPASPKFPSPPRIPQSKVGGFHLLFPFNDFSNKCSLNNLDLRILIKETRKLLKQNFSKPSKAESSTCHVQFSLPWPPQWLNDS